MSISLSSLPAIKTKSKKRIGRGYGSAKGGHTVGRGQKGQKSRNKLPLLFEGSKQRKSLIRRTPFLRGKLRNKPNRQKPLIINLKHLNNFANGDTVDIKSLINKKLLDQDQAEKFGVKILGDGKLEKKLTVRFKCSRSAADKIAKAGGKVELKEDKKEDKNPIKTKSPKPAKGVKTAKAKQTNE